MKYFNKETEPSFENVINQCCCLERPKPDLWLDIKTKEGHREEKLEGYSLEMEEVPGGLLTKLCIGFADEVTFGDINALIQRDYQQDTIEQISIVLKDRCIYCSSKIAFYALKETFDTYSCRRHLSMELHDLVERPDAGDDTESK